MEIGTLFDKIMDYRFIAVGLAIVAILYYFKKFVYRISPAFYRGKVFKTILSVLPLGLGVIASIPKGVLAGDTFTHRVVFGIVAAYFSEKVIYELLLKRLSSLGIEVPEGVLPTPEDREAMEEKAKEDVKESKEESDVKEVEEEKKEDGTEPEVKAEEEKNEDGAEPEVKAEEEKSE